MSTLLHALKIIPSALPEEIPVFPLAGTVLLPQARLPLNVFEPRYLAMVEQALGHGRIIGMIQPKCECDDAPPPLYSVGCAGRITSFTETDDDRLLIVLTGICRFRVTVERKTSTLYRIVRPDWQPYLSDLGDHEPPKIDRDRLLSLMQTYFRKNAISVDWDVVRNAPDDVLVPTIIMICPLEPNEKQALLEVPSDAQRAEMLMALLEMASLPQTEQEAESRH